MSNTLSHYNPIFPHYLTNAEYLTHKLIYHVEIHSYDPHKFLLRMELNLGTETVPETLVSFDHLTLLMAREDFIELNCRESSKSYSSKMNSSY